MPDQTNITNQMPETCNVTTAEFLLNRRQFLFGAGAGLVALSTPVSKYVLKQHSEAAWAMKTYAYAFFENTYAITKLAFGAIKTPAFSPHDKLGLGNDTVGLGSWPELLQDEQKSTQIEMWEDDVDIDTSLSSAM